MRGRIPASYRAPRPPRNQVWVLTDIHRRILSLLAAWDKSYPPIVKDLANALIYSYSGMVRNLYTLDREGYIELVYDETGCIRAIKLLARP